MGNTLILSLLFGSGKQAGAGPLSTLASGGGVFDNFRSSARMRPPPGAGGQALASAWGERKKRERERERQRERIESLHWRFCGDHFDPGVAVRRGTLNPELAVEVRRGVGLGGVKTLMLRCRSLAFERGSGVRKTQQVTT